MKTAFFAWIASCLLIISACDTCKSIECENGGSCESGECDCPIGFDGDRCETEDLCLTRVVNCGENGSCLDGFCSCNDGFSGAECEDEDLCITQNVDCQNGGICEEGTCQCIEKYTGEFCEVWDECAGVQCDYSQPCVEGSCDCNQYTTGEQCEEKLVDRYLGTYTGTWTAIGAGTNIVQPNGTLVFVADINNEKTLRAETDIIVYGTELLLEFVQGDLDLFNVIRYESNQFPESGTGGFDSNGKVSLTYTIIDLGDELTISFEQD
jgi:hypothetical protein